MRTFKSTYPIFILLPAIIIIIISFVIACKNNNPIGSNDSKTIVWQQTTLDTLDITSLATHPQIGILASSCSNPIFRTEDKGKTWSVVHPNTCAYALAINNQPDVFYLSGNGFGRSSNETTSWTYTVVPFRADLKAITFTDEQEIYLGSIWSDETPGGILRSGDNGNTWSKTSFPDSISVRILISFNGYIFVGTGFGVFRSPDNGETWELMNNGFRNVFQHPYVSAMNFHPLNNYLFVAIEGDGVYRSDNYGESWTFTGLTASSISSIIINAKGDIFAGNGSLFGSKTDSVGVHYSMNNGNTWVVIDSGLTNLNILTMATDDSGYIYTGTKGDGVFRTEESTIF